MLKLTEPVPLRPHSKNYCLLATVAVPAGDARDIESELEEFDFNEYLTGGGSDGTFMIRADGDSMEVEIFHDDLIIVNPNLQPVRGNKVVASINGSYTVKIFSPCRNGLHLVAANKKYHPQTVTQKDECEIVGVVTHVVRQLKKFDVFISRIGICFSYGNQKICSNKEKAGWRLFENFFKSG
ncbi:MAG: S24 family peptidase [Acidobacteria bacterium]|nr:S24 family peptidase [Acidobacteriota bacterium]